MVQTSKSILTAVPKRIRALDRSLDAALFRALGDATRLHLVTCLAMCCRPCSVKEVAECCDVDYSVVSRHLAQLAEAGVLTSERSGKSVMYTIAYGSLADALRRLSDAVTACNPEGKKRSRCCGVCCCGTGSDKGGCC